MNFSTSLWGYSKEDVDEQLRSLEQQMAIGEQREKSLKEKLNKLTEVNERLQETLKSRSTDLANLTEEKLSLKKRLDFSEKAYSEQLNNLSQTNSERAETEKQYTAELEKQLAEQIEQIKKYQSDLEEKTAQVMNLNQEIDSYKEKIREQVNADEFKKIRSELEEKERLIDGQSVLIANFEKKLAEKEKEANEQRNEMLKLEAEIEDLNQAAGNDSSAMQESILSTQMICQRIIEEVNQKSNQIIEDANKEGQKTLAQAQEVLELANQQAADIVSKANLQKDAIEQDYLRIQTEITIFRDNVLNIYRRHLALLESLPTVENVPKIVDYHEVDEES